jgi:DNA-binding PadR family transcriptional regulator
MDYWGFGSDIVRRKEGEHMERKLLLLGLLRGEEMHGYQLHDIIDGQLGPGVRLKKATAYRLLSGMAEDGWITFWEEQEGNRPQRRIYAITERGEAAFQRLLRESLPTHSPLDVLGNIGALFLDEIPSAEAAALLSQRRSTVERLLDATRSHETSHDRSVLLRLQTRHLIAELEWLNEIIGRLRSPSLAPAALADLVQPLSAQTEEPDLPGAQATRSVGEARGREPGFPRPKPSPPAESAPRPRRRRPAPKWRPEID